MQRLQIRKCCFNRTGGGLCTDDAPCGYGVWHIDPLKYDESLPAHGGVLYEALPKPVNCALDGSGRVIIAQDVSPFAMTITTTGEVKQLAVPHHTTGPGAVASPDGSVWLASIAADGELSGTATRFRPGSETAELVRFAAPSPNSGRPIHFAFSEQPAIMYVLTTNLFAPGIDGYPREFSMEEVVQAEFDSSWDNIISSRSVYLEGYQTESHRITYMPHPTRPTVAMTFYGIDQLAQVDFGAPVVQEQPAVQEQSLSSASQPLLRGARNRLPNFGIKFDY